MSLIGITNEEKIFNYLKSKGLNDYGVAGLMGNLKAESGLRPDNLQNSFETKLKLTDSEYTAKVDAGTYTNFVKDSAGYGLAQWTYWSRKQNLLNFAVSKKKSISDLEMQLDFLYKELSEGYKTILTALKAATSVLQASNVVLFQFERPANQGESVQKQRAQYGQKYYDRFVKSKSESKGGTIMSNSSLVNCTVKSPNNSGARTHCIDRITPHCVVGQLTAEGIGGCFTKSLVQASCNYGIGTEGRVVLCVDESQRSWCSSSSANDQRAVTIECASDKTDPYTMNSKVYNKLIDLCVDICKRNGKTKLVWISDKTKALAYSPASNEMLLTVHRWFAAKSCPGDWLFSRLGDVANTVTAKLGGSTTSSSSHTTTTTSFPKTPFSVKVLVSDLNIRSEGSMKGTVKGQTGKGTFTITEVNNKGWGKLKSGTGWIYLGNTEYITILSTTASSPASTSSSSTYSVKVTDSALNIRSGAGTNYGVVGVIRDKGTYTIVETKGNWGKLKSGAGWICLDYTKRI